jgi:hypothetical protein
MARAVNTTSTIDPSHSTPHTRITHSANLSRLNNSRSKKRRLGEQKTYNSRDSLVVTHPTTNQPACGFNAVNTLGAIDGDAAWKWW